MTSSREPPILTRFHRRIREKTADPAAPPVLIVALGDSVTQGLTLPDQIEHDAVYHARLKRQLEQRYARCVFSVINAGVNGHTAADGLGRLDRDVIRHQPDLTLIAFGLNDAALLGLTGLDDFAHALRQMIRSIRDKTESDVILLTPNTMLFHSNDRIPDGYRQYEGVMLQLQRLGTLEAFARRIVEVGRDAHVAIADIYGRWINLHQSGIDTTVMLSNGLNHPTAAAHQIAADLLMEVVTSSG